MAILAGPDGVYVKKSPQNDVCVNPCADVNGKKDKIFDVKRLCDVCDAPIHSSHKDTCFCGRQCSQKAWYRRKTLERLGIVDRPLCLHGSFQSYAHTYRSSIDVIITDPPYERDALPLYEDLAKFALKTLHPGGWLLCLTGWAYDWEIRKMFNASGLEYITVCTYLMSSATLKGEKRTSTGLRNWQQQAKPLLWYQKPGGKLDRRRAGTSDLVRARDPIVIEGTYRLDREKFHWQQCLEGFKHIAWLFANPQDVICDPCMGSGTTLVAAYLQNRKHVIGIEKDAETYEGAKQRVSAVEQQTSLNT